MSRAENKRKLPINKLLRSVIGLALFAFILYWVGTSDILNMLRDINPWLFFIALLIWVGGVFLSAFKWKILLESKGEEVGYLESVKFYFIGTFFNRFLPTNIGGDAVRAYELSNKLERRREAYSSVYVERITGLVMLLFLAVISSLIYWNRIPITALVILYSIFLPASIFLFLVSFSKRGIKIFLPFYKLIEGVITRLPVKSKKAKNFKNKIVVVHEAVIEYKGNQRIFILSLILSLVYHVSLAVRVWVLSGSLGEWPPVYFFLFFIPFIDLLLYLPISIRGIGVREVLYLYFFTAVGVSGALAVSMAVLFEIVDTITSALGGMVNLYDSVQKKKE